MDTITLFFVILAVVLAGVTLQAWRLGNDKRDIALLGTFGGLCGVGAAVSVIV